MDTREWPADARTGTPVDEVLRCLRERLPALVVERGVDRAGADGDSFFVRLASNPEAVEVECGPGGRPPFVVSDEYSWIDAPDAAVAAVHQLIRA
ncbi:hypothetical protein AB0D08_12115 [Kitasatospora sp. NPDC048540]|uniref:hypothetical protein n=1 Tax=Kitasatospora sp. NPDC048540 TaxID=3155634 RepID=UPI0034056920